MRGTLRDAPWVAKDIGIIPAYAGNTRVFAALRPAWRDHPRVCGEHTASRGITSFSAGSSPRMRGTLFWVIRPMKACRIIPAYAGNTPPELDVDRARRDHPRVCGEHIKMQSRELMPRGSSPRMRGTRNDPGRFLRAYGIIPAYAGNTPRILR